MLRALFIVYAVASSALLDDATAADAETRAEHIVQLCAEHHRDAVGAAYPDAYHIRHLPSLRGLVVEATQAEVAALKSHEGVCNVARSHEVTHRPDAGRRLDVDALRRNNEWWGKSHNQGKPWNLDRVNGKLDGNDAFEVSSKGTNVFVLDTGLDTLHQEFEGDREVENVGSYSNFHPGGVWEDKEEWDLTSENRAWLKDNNDSDGHGTHCASTAAGKNYGIAPLANVYGMKVLPGGSEGVIVRALDRVYDLVKRKKVKGPTVVSMSLGGKCRDQDGNEGPGTKYCAFETHYARAIRDLRDIGVLTAIAAGNNGEDACEMAPGASRDAVTVGATNINDRITFFSDYGNCVDVMAPGENVAGAASSREYGDERFLDDDVKEYSVLLGTSQATPLVAGSLLLYMQVLKNAEDALHALLNNAETIDSRSKSSCPSNDLLLRAPGTTNKKDLDTSDKEHPCKISGDGDDWGGGDRPEGSDDDDDDDVDANDEEEDQDDGGDEGSCADVGCEAPPRNCFLKKGSSKGKCFDECPDDKAYECYEEECKGTGKDCDDEDECCSGRSCFAKTDGDGTCEKECPDDDKYECYEAPCKGTGGKCSDSDDCCSGRSCFTIKGKDGTCEKECPNDDKYDCYEKPCTDEGDRCSKDGDCCDSKKCFERKDGKATCESKCPDDDKYECYEEPCKGTGGGCSKDSDCCDGRACFETKNGKATCERECPNDSDYKCWVRPTRKPTLEPTRRPTKRPTLEPTKRPQAQPTKRPTQRPTLATPRPSKQPTREPTREPTRKPTAEPSREPTRRPTDKPTARPVPRPTSKPDSPCRNGRKDGDETDVDCGGSHCGPCEEGDRCRRDDDCEEPTDCINDRCRFRPSPRPTKEPTKNPTRKPTAEPSREPTRRPTERPTARPVPRPTSPPESPCRNGRRDGDETDVDCGGSECGPCDRGERCKVSDDCEDPLACIDDRCTFPPTPKPSKEPTDRPVAPSPEGDDDDAVQPSARPSERPTQPKPTPRPTFKEPDACPRMGDLVDADSCPADPSVLPRCGVWKSGDMCLGDGTCGTSSEEGNCFMRRRRLQAAGDPFAVYHVITNSKKKKTSGTFPWWAILLMCLMLVGCCCCGLLIGVYWYRTKTQKADQKKRHATRIAWDERERRSRARRASSKDAPPPYQVEEVKDEVDLDRAVPLAKVERLWTGDDADLDSVVVPAPSTKRIERVWTGGDADLDSVVVPAPRRSAKRIERLWTGDEASLASIEAPPTAKNAPPPRRASAKTRSPRIERTWTGGDAPDSPRENPWRGGARAATGPAYGAYQVSGFPTPERQWTGAAASDSSGSLEAPAAARTPGQKYRQAVTGSAAAYSSTPRRPASNGAGPVAYRSPTSTPVSRPSSSSAGSKSATYWRERAAATRGRAPPPSHLELEPVARPPPRRARSPPRRTAVLGASAAPRRGRPTLLGVEDSTFISGAEDF